MVMAKTVIDCLKCNLVDECRGDKYLTNKVEHEGDMMGFCSEFKGAARAPKNIGWLVDNRLVIEAYIRKFGRTP